MEEMKTNWIWTPSWSDVDADKARVVFFRSMLEQNQTPRSLPVRITADTRYKLYVNGKLAQFGPSKVTNDLMIEADMVK